MVFMNNFMVKLSQSIFKVKMFVKAYYRLTSKQARKRASACATAETNQLFKVNLF